VTQANPFGEVLAALCAAPTKPAMWNVLLKELGTASGVNKAALISHHLPQNNHRILATLGDSINDRENVRLYEEVYCQFDEWTLRFPGSGSERVVQGEDLWPRSELLKSTFYNEFLKKVDVCQMACVAVAGPSGILEGLSIYRGPGEDEFDRQQFAVLEQILPHLRTALYTRRMLLELESRVSDMETALNHLNAPLVLVDATAKVLFANRNARAILDCHVGLVSDGGSLKAQADTEEAALRATLANAISARKGEAAPDARPTMISRAGKRPLQIVAVPCWPETLTTPQRTAAVVFITDPDQRPLARPEALRILFGLSRAETKLAMVLLDGKSLSEAADLNHVGRETVRSQLKSIFLKTGTRRQSELIRLLLKLPEDNTGTVLTK